MKKDVLPRVFAVTLALGWSLVVSSAHAFDPATVAASRQRLHQEQLQDRLSLELQQNLARARPGLSQPDKLRLERLELEQRMEQQRLELEQRADFQRFAHDPDRRRIQQRAYDQARHLQLQRFYVEQQRLLGSTRRAPLQPAPSPGRLRLP